MGKADNFTAHALHLETGAKNESNILYEDALMVQEIKNEPPTPSGKQATRSVSDRRREEIRN